MGANCALRSSAGPASQADVRPRIRLWPVPPIGRDVGLLVLLGAEPGRRPQPLGRAMVAADRIERRWRLVMAEDVSDIARPISILTRMNETPSE